MARTKQKVLEDQNARKASAQASSSGAAASSSSGAASSSQPPQFIDNTNRADGSDEENEEEFVVEAIVSQRYVRKRLQYEVKWKDDEQTTWEPAANLKDTEALEEWVKASNVNNVAGRFAEEEEEVESVSECDESECDAPARKRRRPARTRTSTTRTPTRATRVRRRATRTASTCPNTGRERVPAKTRQRMAPPLNDRQKALIREGLHGLSKESLARTLEEIAAEKPEVYGTLRQLLTAARGGGGGGGGGRGGGGGGGRW